MIRYFSIFILGLLPTFLAAEDIRIAVTTSFDNSGLADILMPEIFTETGLNVQVLVVGTGQALRLGAAGDVDAVLVHSRAAEDAFVAASHGTHRREIMYNDFVLIGPEDDPALLAASTTIHTAMVALASSGAAFISRGDDSGTHKAEQRLWASAGLNVAAFENWYHAVGAGMGAALNTATALDGYILSDRASWLNFGNKGNRKILFSGDPALFNQYAFIPVHPDKGRHVRHANAVTLEAWLTSDRARDLINDYSIAGQQLFVFNAGPLIGN